MLGLDSSLKVLKLTRFDLELLLQLFVISLLFADNRVAFDDLLLGLLELLLHFADLTLVHGVSVCKLVGLLLER